MPDADRRLIEAHDLALDALREVTPASTVGPAAGYLVEDDGSVSLRFQNRLPGYPGWYWTVTVGRVEDEEPTVLEVELLPGDGALLAPEWVPWAERLAEYRAHQTELAEQAAAAAAEGEASAELADDGLLADDDADIDDELDEDDLEDDDLDDDLDVDDLDDDDEDPSESRVLHAGDLDGVDIDELDDSAGFDDDEDAAEDAEAEDAEDADADESEDAEIEDAPEDGSEEE